MENLTKTQLGNLMFLFMADNIKSANYKPNTLWEMVCDSFEIDYENEELGEIFDTIWENNYIKNDILSLGAQQIVDIYNKNYKEFDEYCKNNPIDNQ